MGLFSKLFQPDTDQLLWQNILLAQPNNKLVTTKERRIKMTEEQLQRNIEIFDDSSSIINETINADTFFSRMELAEECLAKIKRLEPFLKYQKKFAFSESPTQLIEKFSNEKQKYIESFLCRSSNAVKEKASGMKTEKGKQNQYKKFNENMQPYLCKMNESNIHFIRKFVRENIKSE